LYQRKVLVRCIGERASNKPSMKRLICLLLALGMFAVPASISAKGLHVKPSTKAEHKETVIESISATSISVKHPNETKTYVITKDTGLFCDGKKVDISALSAGMRVSITAGADPKVASIISAKSESKK
jgi:hypothetical protein